MPRNPNELLRQAWDALESEEYEQAEALGRRALLFDPESTEARLVIGRSLLNSEEYSRAAEPLAEAVEADPEDMDALTDLGIALFQCLRFGDAETPIRRAVEIDPSFADAHYWLGLCLERRAAWDEADQHFARAHEIDPEQFQLPVRIDRAECERAVRSAFDQLPVEVRKAIENVSIEIEDLPPEALLKQYDPPMDPCLLGLFEGVPATEGTSLDVPRLPNRVWIFQRNLERECSDEAELVDQVMVTLMHEIGHSLGLDEDHLADSGYE